MNPISKKSEISNFNYSSEESGAALSSFKLKNKKIINFYKMNSISVRDLKKNYNIKKPDHVKIDVDGNEFEIAGWKGKTQNGEDKISIQVSKPYVKDEATDKKEESDGLPF